MNSIIKLITGSLLGIYLMMQPLRAQVVITVQIRGAVNPFLAQTINNNNGSIHVTIQGISGNSPVQVYAKLERILPTGFTIQLKPGSTAKSISHSGDVSNDELAAMFGYFNPDKLTLDKNLMADLRDGINYKLPEGSYNLCFSTDREFNDPSKSSCASFTICQPAAPQFIQPVNSVNNNISSITNVQPASPLVFTWMPPRYACGIMPNIYNYNLEIREIFINQAIIDAVNNPVVFRKNSISSPIFLLDTNLYKDVLQQGRKYIIRVKANAIGNLADTAIENYGYSRIEAFQYGNSRDAQNSLLPPRFIQQSYITYFDEHLSSKLDDIYSAVQKQERADTAIDLKNYIRLILMENNITYSLDAVELFLSMNQDIIDNKHVKLSYKPRLPEFPTVSEKSRESFDREHATNLNPDSLQAKIFITYTDSLAASIRTYAAADTSAVMMEGLISKLHIFGSHVYDINRVSVKLVNDYLSELLYNLKMQKPLDKKRYEAISTLVNSIEGLTLLSSVTAFSWHPALSSKKSSLCSYAGGTMANGRSGMFNFSYLPPAIDRPLPFNIIVYHYSKEDPTKIVLNAADLMATYRVFYVPSGLFNHQNPEINAQNTTAPASTAQVTLPETKFMFWTQNTSNHQLTKAQEINLMDAYLNNSKKWPYPARASIVLKVE